MQFLNFCQQHFRKVTYQWLNAAKNSNLYTTWVKLWLYCLQKFRFSKKATKIWSYLQLRFDFTDTVEISNIVAFSENLNFRCKGLFCTWIWRNMKKYLSQSQKHVRFLKGTTEQRSSLVGSQPTLSHCMTFEKNRQQLGEETTKLGLLGNIRFKLDYFLWDN